MGTRGCFQAGSPLPQPGCVRGGVFPSCFAILGTEQRLDPKRPGPLISQFKKKKKTLKGEEGGCSTIESWQAECPEAKARGSMSEAESGAWQAGRKRLAEGLQDPLSCLCHSHVD